jgi:hypothetical protein
MADATQVQIRRDTNSGIMGYTLAEGEIGLNLTTGRQHSGNGVTPGGIINPNYFDCVDNPFNTDVDTGVANAYVLDVVGWGSGPNTFQEVIGQIANDNTTTSTLNANGTGDIEIRVMTAGGLVSLSGGELKAGGIYRFMFTGTYWMLLNPTPVANDPAGLKLITTVNVSAQSSIVFTNLDSSVYEKYVIALDGLKNTAGGQIPYLRVSTNNGSSYLATGTYDSELQTSALGPYNSGAQIALSATGGGGFDPLVTSQEMTGEISVQDISNTTRPKIFESNFTFASTTSATRYKTHGANGTTSAINAVQLTLQAGAGTWASGKARLYGRKAA